MKGYVNSGQKNQQCLHCRKVIRKGQAGMRHPFPYYGRYKAGNTVLYWHRDCLQDLLNEAPLSEEEAVDHWQEIMDSRLDALLFSDESVKVVQNSVE